MNMRLLLTSTLLLSAAVSQASATTLGVAQDFNAFIFGSYNSSSDSEGPLAVGGNLTVSNFALNANHVQKPWSGVVGGDFTAQNGGSVYGNVIVGGNVNVPSYYLPNIQQVSPSNPLPVNFAAALIAYRGLAQGLSELPGIGPSYQYQGQRVFTGVDPDLNVFNLDGPNLAQYLAINAPASSTVIVNVSGTTIAWSNFSVALQGVNRTKVLFNFYEATSISMTNIAMEGSVLAPDADLFLTYGGMNGNTIAKSWQPTTTEPHWHPFAGNIPDSAWGAETPEPGTFAAVGACFLFAAARLRRVQSL